MSFLFSLLRRFHLSSSLRLWFPHPNHLLTNWYHFWLHRFKLSRIISLCLIGMEWSCLYFQYMIAYSILVYQINQIVNCASIQNYGFQFSACLDEHAPDNFVSKDTSQLWLLGCFHWPMSHLWIWSCVCFEMAQIDRSIWYLYTLIVCWAPFEKIWDSYWSDLTRCYLI